MDELKKIDIIRERMRIGYREAKIALDEANGDVVQALINCEDGVHNKETEKIDKKGKQLINHIREIIKSGNVTKVRLKKGEKVIFEIPATVGALGVGGALFSLPLALLGVGGTIAAVINKCSLEIIRPDGTVEKQDLNFLGDDIDDEQVEHTLEDEVEFEDKHE